VTAMTLHFNSERDYDAFKFNFKGPRCKRETFEKNKNRFQFEKLARKYPHRNDIVLYSLANLLNDKKWIGDFTDSNFDKWKAKIQSLRYDFEQEWKHVIEETPYKTFDEMILPSDLTDTPYIYKILQSGKISIESLTILNILSGFQSDLEKKLTDPLGISSEINFKIRKYTPFLVLILNTKMFSDIIQKLWFTRDAN